MSEEPQPPLPPHPEAGGHGAAPDGEPSQGPLLLDEEIAPKTDRGLRLTIYGALLLGMGVLAGLWLAPDTPQSARSQVRVLQQALAERDARIAALETQAKAPNSTGQGRLKPQDRARHVREGRAYVASLKRTGAQGAARLVAWFINRWNALLDDPQPDDRTGRRAVALAQLVGGMAANLNPGDYIPWQSEFLSKPWLGEVHLDIDGDGLPGPRTASNPHDGFADVSVCHVAMALNQTMTDGQILMMPEMHCDRAESRMSVFLQGETLNDAMNEFVRAVREQGFLVVEKQTDATWLVLVGPKPVAPKVDDDGL